MILLLRSPLHMLASKSTLLITFTGRKSGKSYTTPVNYVPDGDVLYIVSLRSRTWWRNLRGGAHVIVRLRGRSLEAEGDVIEDYESVEKELMKYLQKVPQYGRYFKVRLDPGGHPDPEDVARAAQDRVMIRLLSFQI
ncbi:MAG: nitroreductase family deazaflavin-dependent oxidoreductase [Candidatus Methanoperedens sp.]|nr:nitroreductase family deazaflavin-dependent oxidoreductase [Candidatus Methanoperedens sp.]